MNSRLSELSVLAARRVQMNSSRDEVTTHLVSLTRQDETEFAFVTYLITMQCDSFNAYNDLDVA